MTDDRSSDNQWLLTRLGAVVARIDGPPDLVYEVGRAAFAWRRVDSELAQLLADSRLDLSVVRGRAVDDRLLSFGTPEMIVEVQVSVRRGTRRLLGQVRPEPPVPGGMVSLEATGGPAISMPLDSVGRFELAGVPSGTRRFRVEAPGRAAATTVWVDL